MALKESCEDMQPLNTRCRYWLMLGQESINQYIATLSTKVCLDQANAYYVSPAFNGSSTARDQVGSLMTACFILTGANYEQQIKNLFEEAIAACEYMG